MQTWSKKSAATPPWLHVVPGILCLSKLARWKKNKKWWSRVVEVLELVLGRRESYKWTWEFQQPSTTTNGPKPTINYELTLDWCFYLQVLWFRAPFHRENKNQTQSESKTTFRHFDVWWSFFLCAPLFIEKMSAICAWNMELFFRCTYVWARQTPAIVKTWSTRLYAKGPDLTFIIHCEPPFRQNPNTSIWFNPTDAKVFFYLKSFSLAPLVYQCNPQGEASLVVSLPAFWSSTKGVLLPPR